MKKHLWVFFYSYDNKEWISKSYSSREAARVWFNEYKKDLDFDGMPRYKLSPIKKYELK